MKRTDFSNTYCSIARALNVVGEWWTLLIIRDIFLGNRRFSGFLKSLGISKKVLSDRLDTLQNEGIIVQKPSADGGLRLEYHLTEKGKELGPILLSLMAWGDKWVFDGNPPVTLVHKNCNNVTLPKPICDACNEPIQFHELTGTPTLTMSKDAQERWESTFMKE